MFGEVFAVYLVGVGRDELLGHRGFRQKRTFHGVWGVHRLETYRVQCIGGDGSCHGGCRCHPGFDATDHGLVIADLHRCKELCMVVFLSIQAKFWIGWV